MGTVFHFQIEDELGRGALERVCRDSSHFLSDANDRFSLYRADSEISKLNSGELTWSDASEVQKKVRALVEFWHDKTSGFFDAKVGESNYDPSGLVKTWATQRAADYLEKNGVRGYTLNAGGDVLLSRELSSETLKQVGLANLRPIASGGAGANLVLDLKGTDYRAVATSGSVERGEHIWRQDATSEFVQVTVVGVDLVEADIWATALISGGRPAWRQFDQSRDDRMVAVATSKSGELFSTAGFVELLATL